MACGSGLSIAHDTIARVRVMSCYGLKKRKEGKNLRRNIFWTCGNVVFVSWENDALRPVWAFPSLSVWVWTRQLFILMITKWRNTRLQNDAHKWHFSRQPNSCLPKSEAIKLWQYGNQVPPLQPSTARWKTWKRKEFDWGESSNGWQ